ncbi:hypothetical protein YC2023_075109 [Brassica napus]
MGVYGPGVGGLVTAISSTPSRTTEPPVCDFGWASYFVDAFSGTVFINGCLGSCRFYPLLHGLSRLSLWELAATGASLISFLPLGHCRFANSIINFQLPYIIDNQCNFNDAITESMKFMLTYHDIHHPDSTLLIQETNQYVMKVLTNMDNNTTDDLQFTLTIKGYSQNVTAKLDGGDDVVIRSVTEPEVNPKPYSTSQGAKQNTCTLKMPYLTNQEGLSHEKNFNGLYTQEGVHPIWNKSKIFTEKEVMNFTSQRFSSPSICEYPTLEGDLSSSKEQPEANPIKGVKRSLSDFHKAQDHKKWPRNYEVMIQSPKPVNPVLHLPQLEANRFNQLQTRHWRPGDHFNQSGDILGVQEEFCKFIPCTSNHWIRRILIYSNLPYLEQTDINVQQLFSLQSRHEIRTYHAPRKDQGSSLIH